MAAVMRIAGEPGTSVTDAEMIRLSLREPVVLRENLLPPRTEAAVFLAMKKIPGVTLADNAADAAGRPIVRSGTCSHPDGGGSHTPLSGGDPSDFSGLSP
jgi:hypothetical protein